MKIQTASAIAVTMMVMTTGAFFCTNVDFTNPLDKNGSTFAGDSAIADHDNDGVPNLYDPDCPQWVKKSWPTINFVGPDTVIIAKDDPNHVLATLDYSATDSVYGDIPKDSIKDTGKVYTSVDSTYIITYTVTNRIGNSTKRSRVIIVDCYAPELTLLPPNPMRLSLGSAFTDPGATAVDKLDGNMTGKIKVTGPANINKEGTDTVTYSVTDRAGNLALQKRIVIVYKEEVKDTVRPVITLVGANPLILKEKQPYTEPGYSAKDDVDGDITSKVTITGLPVNTSVPGKDTLTYSVQDMAGNKAYPKQRIIVIQGGGGPNEPPVITFLGNNPCTLKVGTPWVDPGYTAWDDHDGDVTNKVVPPATPPNTNVPGTYTLKYSVTDSEGLTGSYIRFVVVVGTSTDTEKPVIRLEGAAKCTVGVGKQFVDPGVTATDNIDGVITNKVTKVCKNSAGTAAELSTFTSVIGDYTITYSVSDAAGNPAIPVTRAVRVKDTTTIPAEVLLKKYGVPLAGPLPSVSASYTSATVDGTGGPDVSTVQTLRISWRLEGPALDDYSMQLSGPPHYISLKEKCVNTFAQPGPAFTLTGSGIAGLDGEYYINATKDQCAWVKKDGSYAVVFKP